MFSKLTLLGLLLVTVVTLVSSTSNFHPVLHIISPPKSIDFKEAEPINSSSLADFFSTTLGYTVRKSSASHLNGIHGIKNVLNLPRSLVVIEVFSDDEIINDVDSVKFPLEKVGDLENQFDILAQRTYDRYPDKDPLLLKVEFAEQELIAPFGEYAKLLTELSVDPEKRLELALKDEQLAKLINEGTFDISLPEAKLFIIEVGTAKQLIDAVEKLSTNVKSKRDIFWLEIHGYLQMMKSTNYKPETKIAAQNLLHGLINEFSDRFEPFYGNTMLAVIEQNESSAIQRRATRSLMADNKDKKANATLNLAHVYETDFHAAFAALAVSSLMMAMTFYGISVATWHMDPGRDSIIYRMTSQRIKKDQ